jgi:hypothetical protein
MTNEQWIEMLRVIPEDEHHTLVLVLQNGSEISVDTLFRFDPFFLVLRGRQGGTTDEGRAFFVPYDQMLYFRIERVTKLADLQVILENRLIQSIAPTAPPAPVSPAPIPVSASPTPLPGGTPVSLDPSATRNALLDRIRAAKASHASQSAATRAATQK